MLGVSAVLESLMVQLGDVGDRVAAMEDEALLQQVVAETMFTAIASIWLYYIYVDYQWWYLQNSLDVTVPS